MIFHRTQNLTNWQSCLGACGLQECVIARDITAIEQVLSKDQVLLYGMSTCTTFIRTVSPAAVEEPRNCQVE